METLIIMSLVLAILQLWLIPMTIDIKNLNWMIGNRDSSIPQSPLVTRAKRAGSNLQESLPAFLALALLSMILSIDVTNAPNITGAPGFNNWEYATPDKTSAKT